MSFEVAERSWVLLEGDRNSRKLCFWKQTTRLASWVFRLARPAE
ncbi:hypothetical protein A2U01_0029349, partial [Trifolium medium]|nr:hypothetical protein [Trifolium medium]